MSTVGRLLGRTVRVRKAMLFFVLHAACLPLWEGRKWRRGRRERGGKNANSTAVRVECSLTCPAAKWVKVAVSQAGQITFAKPIHTHSSELCTHTCISLVVACKASSAKYATKNEIVR